MVSMAFASDEEQATCFLTELFTPYVGTNAYVEIRTFTKPFPRRWFPVSSQGLSDAATFAVSLRDRFDVYMGVLPRVNGGGGSEHLRVAGWLWVDLDAGEDDLPTVYEFYRSGMSKKAIPAPSMIVVSGYGLHCYWRLAEPVSVRTEEDRERLRKTNARLCLLFNGEVIDRKDEARLSRVHACQNTTEAARVLRVPGTINRKRANLPDPAKREERIVRLMSMNESATHPLLWWVANLPAMPLPPRRQQRVSSVSISSSLSLPPLTRDKIATGAGQGMRHYTMRDVAISAVKEGYDETSIRALVEQTARASGVDVNSSHESRHVDGIVAWAVANITPDPFQPQGGYTR